MLSPTSANPNIYTLSKIQTLIIWRYLHVDFKQDLNNCKTQQQQPFQQAA